MMPLKDALYNLHPDTGTNPMYARGVLVGAIATLMQIQRNDFEMSVKTLKEMKVLPNKIMTEAIPDGWEKYFTEYTK